MVILDADGSWGEVRAGGRRCGGVLMIMVICRRRKS